MKEELYLDNAATVKPECPENMMLLAEEYIKNKWYNPSSKYSKGQNIRKLIEDARQTTADFIGANNKDEIYFTSGASESNSWAIQGFVKQCEIDGYTPVIITSHIEHSSILKTVEAMKPYSAVFYVKNDEFGFVDHKDLEDILIKCTTQKSQVKILVSIIAANNEIGTVQNIVKLCELAHKYNAMFHTDATQLLHYRQLHSDIPFVYDVDMLSASAQKFGGIKGAGFLYIKDYIRIQPLIYGEQESHLRGGTENVFGILSMELAIKNYNYDIMDNVEKCRNYLEKLLINRFNCKINGSNNKFWRLPNNVNVTFNYNLTGEALIYILDMDGIYISAGSACNSSSNEPSHVLKAIGLTDEEANRTIRISLPDGITIEKIDYFIDRLEKAIKLLTS